MLIIEILSSVWSAQPSMSVFAFRPYVFYKYAFVLMEYVVFYKYVFVLIEYIVFYKNFSYLYGNTLIFVRSTQTLVKIYNSHARSLKNTKILALKNINKSATHDCFNDPYKQLKNV